MTPEDKPVTSGATWKVIGQVLLFGLAMAAVFMAAVPAITAAMPHPWNRLAFGVLATALGYVVTLAFVRVSGSSLARVGLAWRRSSLGRGLLGAAIGAGIFSVHVAVVLTAGAGQLQFERLPDVGMSTAGIIVFAYLALAAMEEIAFRGYPLRMLYEHYGLWVAQVAVAIAFIVYHVAGGQGLVSAIIGTGLGSLLFGMAAIATRGLAVPIGLHATWNFCSWMVGDKPDPGPWRVVIGEDAMGRMQAVASISYVAVLSLTTVGFWWWYRVRIKSH